jgi:hypothetical protein
MVLIQLSCNVGREDQLTMSKIKFSVAAVLISQKVPALTSCQRLIKLRYFLGGVNLDAGVQSG